uniref:Uncharacterized protein n=1 Tax=Chipolycivirus sp. TaxID=2809300 RepID=A0AAU8JNV1_9VIRU
MSGIFNFNDNNYVSPRNLVSEEFPSEALQLSNYQSNILMFPASFDAKSSNVLWNTNFNGPNPNTIRMLESLNQGDKMAPFNLADIQTFSEHPEVSEALEASEGVEEAESVAPEAFGDSTFLGGLGVAMASHLASNQVTQDVNKDLSGQGVAGSDFGSAFQAREDAQHDSQVGMENMALIGGSALLGPEGLAVGLISAGMNSAFNQADVASVQSNLGTQVPVNSM